MVTTRATRKTTVDVNPRRSVADRATTGKEARRLVPRSSQGELPDPAAGRDPVALLREQDATREPDLVPVRHGRMMLSPFAFYRGAARLMAHDLKGTPRAGLQVQLCGDAHLSNFGLFASPERTLLFDLNDFDETLPGPFEYDLKRLAASFYIAGRNNGFTDTDCRAAASQTANVYRNAMAEYAGMKTLDVWYSRIAVDDIVTLLQQAATKKQMARVAKTVDRARLHDSTQALAKLGEMVDGTYRIVSQPPLVVPVRDIAHTFGLDPGAVNDAVRTQLDSYRTTLAPERAQLLDRFELVDVARKVVGVGSVGTRAFIALLEGRDQQDPLFLQVKEATRSVLEEHLPRSVYRNHGERVVVGQRTMQAASDIFLGWTHGLDENRHFYWRQLRDMKGAVDVERLVPAGLVTYARICGWALARAHARSGDPIAISAYVGRSDTFDRAITEFSARYADRNEQDYEAFCEAIDSGALEARQGV
jgi:uncharacterized protein (DUF2252 family)